MGNWRVNMDQERRKAKRINIKVTDCCLENKGEKTGTEILSVDTKDISSRGAHLIIPEKLKRKEQFLIGFNLPALCNPLSFQCEIVWTKKSDQNYEVGIRFLKVDPYDIGKLERFLRLRDVSVKEPVCQN